ncbi:MAG TPA: hypothetical protein VNT75_10830, partial [Symbiobacteriaceae bacterium]|nr:hypothetical protein [Symbiobacteriaceae bacterium]
MVKPVIQVCGDPIVDWLSPRRDGAQAVRLTAEPGGAALLTRLVSTLVPAATVEGITISPDSPLLREPGTDDVATTWSVWRQYASDGGRTYRLEAVHERESGAWKHEVSGLPKPDLLLIDDDNLGFRDDQAAWPRVLKSAGPRPRAIILLQRDCGGPLLDHLKATGLAARTTLVISVEALRACSVKVSPSLSWERLFDEVVAAVLSPACPFLAGSDLAFARVIVSIGTAGAVMV